MAGRVQIEALGQLSNFLTVDPSFSFFTKRYSKYANYANENYKISFPKGVYTDDFLDVTIPQNCGDILQEVTLSFTVDPTKVASLGSNISPIDTFGISMIDYVELRVGDQIIDTITSDDIFIDRELNIPESYKSSLDVIHGKHFQGSSDREFLQEFYDGQFSTQGIDPFSNDEYRIQIPFYFNRRPGHGFPLCAVTKQELSLRIKLRSTNDVLFVSQEKFGQTIWNPRENNQVTEPLELSNFKINLGVVHLDTTERCMLRSKPIDIMFEQRQRNTFLIDEQSKVGNFRLDFKNCVKELFFIAKKIGKWSDEYVSILDQLHQLDNYTDAQQTTLLILKLIPVWSGAIGNVLDTLVGETDTTVRTSLVDAVLNLFYWGTDDTYTSVLEALKTQSVDDQTNVTTIKTYLNSIPGTILAIQLDATEQLNSLIGETDLGTRSTTIDALLAYDNVWGAEQIGLLNNLRYPGIPTEGLLIFGLRVYLTTVSYYLTGLSQLKPGTTEQVATINKVTELFDNTKAEYDVLKFGLKGVLDDIPGKTAYTRARIIYAIIKVGTFTLGQNRAIWSATQLTQLNSLTVDPGANADLIATQRATIDSLIGFLDSLDDIKGFITEQFTLLNGETNYDTRDDIINNLLNLVNFYKGPTNTLDLVNPNDFWTQTEVDLLEELRNSNAALAGTATEDTYIGTLTTYAIGTPPTYTDGQTVSDSIYAKNTIDGLLTLLDGETVQATRQTLVDALLAFDVKDVPGVEDRLYWDEDTNYLITVLGYDVNTDAGTRGEVVDKVLAISGITWSLTDINNLNALKDSGTSLANTTTEDVAISAIRVYMNAVVYGLRLIIDGLVGTTGIQYTIDRLLTALDGETDQPTREDLVDGLLAIPGVWRQTEVDLLNALKDAGTPLGGTADEDTYIAALRVQSDTFSFINTSGIIPESFPGATVEERIANVTVLRLLPVWEDTIIKLVNGWSPGSSDTTTLVNYLTGKLGSIPILKFRLNVLKNGINGILDTLPAASAAERDPIIVGISTLYAWGDTQFYCLNELRTPPDAGYEFYDLIYINALKISTGSLELDTLTTDPTLRAIIVGGLLALPNIWSTEQTALINALFVSANDATTIPALNALVTNVPIMSGYTQFDQNNVIDGIISETIWGEKYFNLNDLRQIEPGFVGQTTVISDLGTYITGLDSALGYIVNGIDATLDYVKTLSIGDDRTNILSNIASFTTIWTGTTENNILDEMKTSDANDDDNVTDLKTYIDNEISLFDTAVGYLAPTHEITSGGVSGEVDALINEQGDYYKYWGADQISVLNQLKLLVDARGPGGIVTDGEIYFKYVLDLYVKGIRFYWNLVEEGISSTVSTINTVTNSVERGVLVGLLINFPIWGTAQLTLLNELRTVDSKNHSDAIDAITTYLDSAADAIYNASGPSGLLVDIAIPTTTSSDLQDNDVKKAIWGGYFYYLLEALQNPAIATGTEAGIIAKLSTHILISQSSESRTNNLNYLLRQLLTAYPETIFNKWVRAKKNVPLMYSKQKYLTLECDGVKILDETSGSNMFLSASLPNLYHKRSPNFRNINMYSFALKPQDLEPSGHLNFSTVKDANVYMELQYDGAHGTFDFDDNYIELFGIDPIYFPKQVIIIAKSYNTMIIRDGVARIIF